MKHSITTMHSILFLLFFISTQHLHALDNQQRNCIILLDQTDSETVGRTVWFLISKLQSVIAEQSTPVLINTSLWNSFIERRINFKQMVEQKSGPLYKTYNLYKKINERMEYLSHHYNALSSDASHNKKLVIQCINKEFYHSTKKISAAHYQRLLDYSTQFDPQDWDIYKNNGGFYLLIPKKYSAQHSLIGFNIDSLEKVTDPEDSSCNYFEAHTRRSIVDALPDFFLTHDNFTDQTMPYAWNIIFSGHGGSRYAESNDNDTITWSGEPVIADLTVQDFTDVLTFFQNKVSTRFFHYASCYGAGNHIPLIFKDKYYNFAIMCDNLTDCATYCKWTTLLPSDDKQFLTTADVRYNQQKSCWQLPLTPVYFWNKFFTDISSIDFSIGSIERLQSMMSSIQYSIIANIPLLCLPETNNFFPLQLSNIIKIDDRLLALAKTEDESITLDGIATLLLESTCIIPTIELNHTNPLRIISIKAGEALHYIKKLELTRQIDLPSVFWQAQYQRYDKTFILDECTFPYSYHTPGNIIPQKDQIILTNVIIAVEKNNCMRVLFTYNDKAMMLVAHKPNEESEQVTIQEVVPMTPVAQDKYEKYYALLKETALGKSVA